VRQKSNKKGLCFLGGRALLHSALDHAPYGGGEESEREKEKQGECEYNPEGPFPAHVMDGSSHCVVVDSARSLLAEFCEKAFAFGHEAMQITPNYSKQATQGIFLHVCRCGS
jgi:hypothetical protein